MVVPLCALLTSPVGAGLARFGLRSFTVNDPSLSFPSPPPPSKTAWVAFRTRFDASRDSLTAYALILLGRRLVLLLWRRHVGRRDLDAHAFFARA